MLTHPLPENLAPQPAPQAAPPHPSPKPLFPQNVVGFTVRPGGDIDLPRNPARFTVGSHEIIVWLIGNQSGHDITVRLQDWLRNNQPVDPEPLRWLGMGTVQVGNNKTGFIAATKNLDYEHVQLIDRVKYTIRVQADDGSFARNHDPDGDIKP